MIRTLIRTVRPADLLLPIGAALVTAGLEHLAGRERRQRGRLLQLAQLVDEHRDALVDAGVTVPGELAEAADEPAPEHEWLAPYGRPEPGEKVPARKRPWKLAAAAVLSVAGVTLVRNREAIAAAFLSRVMPADELSPDALPEPHPHSGVRIDLDELHETGETRIEGFRHHLYDDGVPAAEGQGDLDPSLESQDQDVPPAPPAEVDLSAGPDVEPAEICEWPNCDWTSDPGRSLMSQQTQAAVHRNRCIYRPSGAKVD